jgi:hypothetical protein
VCGASGIGGDDNDGGVALPEDLRILDVLNHLRRQVAVCKGDPRKAPAIA